MSTKILVVFETIYGSTEEVAEALAQVFREAGADVEVSPARDVHEIGEYSAVLLGAPLANHHLHRDAHGFFSRQLASVSYQ